MKERADDFFDLRFEFNDRVLEENIKKGQNAVSKQMYITLTIHSADDENAIKKFRSLNITLTNAFTRIGTTNIRAMSNAERLELLKTYFVGDEARTVPELDEKSLKRREDRLYICPDYFEFKKDYFMFDNTYAKAICIREFPSTGTSQMLNDLLATGVELMVTTNIEAYDSGSAKKLVQKQITAIDTDMAKREVKAAQHGNFSTQMPQRIKNQRDSMVSVYDKSEAVYGEHYHSHQGKGL